MGILKTGMLVGAGLAVYGLGMYHGQQKSNDYCLQLQERVVQMQTIDYKVKSLLIEADANPDDLAAVFEKYIPRGE